MKTWNDYKEHIKKVFPTGEAEISEIEALSKIISPLLNEEII